MPATLRGRMSLLVLKLTLAPGLVVVTTLAGRRWGPRAAGWLGGGPGGGGAILLAPPPQRGGPVAAASGAAARPQPTQPRAPCSGSCRSPSSSSPTDGRRAR